ncbi:MAG TPA: hypothetical protein VFU81_15295 [Thermomicrobiales bacterium]|nr:hypothetical protein [Thermomicrobiales bacterium]
MWRSESPDAIDRLARFWEAFAAEGAVSSSLPDDLDPALVATVRELHARDDARLPDPAFVNRLERSLLRVIAETPRAAPALATVSGGRIWSMPDARTPAGRRMRCARRPWPVSQLAAAAMLLLTLGFGYVSLRATGTADRDGRFPAIVSTSGPATPDGVSAPVHVLRLTLTRSFGKSQSGLGVWRSTFPPGAYDREIGRPDMAGDQIFFVESGTITARLVAGDQPPETLGTGLDGAPVVTTPEAGGQLKIDAGQAALLPGGTTVELRNDGAAPASLLWILVNWTTQSDTNGVTWNSPGSGAATLPAPPVTLTLDRATLAPNAKIAAAPPPAITSIGLIDPPFGYLLVDRDGSARNISASPRDVYIMTITPLQPTPTP